MFSMTSRQRPTAHEDHRGSDHPSTGLTEAHCFLEQDEGRDGRDPHQSHHATDEQQAHQNPAAAETVGTECPVIASLLCINAATHWEFTPDVAQPLAGYEQRLNQASPGTMVVVPVEPYHWQMRLVAK